MSYGNFLSFAEFITLSQEDYAAKSARYFRYYNFHKNIHRCIDIHKHTHHMDGKSCCILDIKCEGEIVIYDQEFACTSTLFD